MATERHLIAEDKEIFLSLCHVTMRDFVINLLQLEEEFYVCWPYLQVLIVAPDCIVIVLTYFQMVH